MSRPEVYQLLRNEEWRMDDYLGNYTAHPPVAERQPGTRPVDYHDALEEGCLFPERLLGEVPVATVTAPVGLRSETVTGMLRSARVVEQAVRDDDCGPVELVIWGNVKLPAFRPGKGWPKRPSDEQIIAEGAAKHDDLRAALEAEQFDTGVLRARIVSDVIPASTLNTMVRVRRNALEALLVDGAERNYPGNHPDIWLDGGDLLQITKQTLSRTIAAIERSKGTRLVKARHVYSGDPDDQTPLHERDMAEKTAIVFAIAHRMINRSMGPFPNVRYIEECGLGFQRKLSAVIYLDDMGISARAGEARQLETALRMINSRDVYICEMVAGTQISTSYRGIQEKARTEAWPERLVWDICDNTNYKTYVELSENAEIEAAIRRRQRRGGPNTLQRRPRDLLTMANTLKMLSLNRRLSARELSYLQQSIRELGISDG